MRGGASALARNHLHPVRVAVEKDESEAQRSSIWIERSKNGKQSRRSAAIGQHVQLGAEVGRLIQLARSQAVCGIQNKASEVVGKEAPRGTPIDEGDRREDYSQVPDYVRHVQPDWPRA